MQSLSSSKEFMNLKVDKESKNFLLLARDYKLSSLSEHFQLKKLNSYRIPGYGAKDDIKPIKIS